MLGHWYPLLFQTVTAPEEQAGGGGSRISGRKYRAQRLSIVNQPDESRYEHGRSVTLQIISMLLMSGVLEE